jgi:hypothetical protein
VDPGGYPPGPPTDPDVQNSRIRLLIEGDTPLLHADWVFEEDSSCLTADHHKNGKDRPGTDDFLSS